MASSPRCKPRAPQGESCRESFLASVPLLESDNLATLAFPVAAQCEDAESPNDFSPRCARGDATRSADPAQPAGMSCRTCSGSSPSHAGFCAVLSKMELVLNGSYLPAPAAFRVFASSA